MRSRSSVASFLLLLTAFLALAAPAQSATIEPRQSTLALGDSESLVFTASGSTDVWGLEFNVQVGDGGSAWGGSNTAPPINEVNLLNGTIFGSDANEVDVATTPLAWQSTVDTLDPPVTPSGKVATVQLDTSALSWGGTFTIQLHDVASGLDTKFFSPSAEFISTSTSTTTIEAHRAGDADRDLSVDDSDLSTLLTNFDESGTVWSQGNFNGDNLTNDADLASLLSTFNTTASSQSITAVPEPSTSTFALMGVGGAALIRRRRSTP